jgi:phosphoribosylamine--glycine ligase
MLTAEGPKVLEYNCRFGDPETQVVLPRLRSDLAEALLACVEGDLGQHPVEWSPDACVGVVLASRGYPGPYPTGMPIEGLDKAAATAGLPVFHSGTAVRDGRVVTAGGRVLTVSALGPTVQDARDRAYEACSLIEFDGLHFRRDIAERTP